MMEKLCTHPNVGGVLFVSLGRESFDKVRVSDAVSASDRPVKTLVIQKAGGTASTIDLGRAWHMGPW
jgi:altronate hydrolase